MPAGTAIAKRSGVRLRPVDPTAPLLDPTELESVVAGNKKTVMLTDEPTIRDQGTVPCCVSTAVVHMLETVLAARQQPIDLSPLFHYYVSRPDGNSLSWIDIARGLHRAAQVGICAQTLHAEEITAVNARLRPSTAAAAEARSRRFWVFDPITQIPLVRSLPDADRAAVWHRVLAAGAPIILGFHTTDAYFSLKQDGEDLPDPTGQSHGSGHAVAILGYHRDRGFFVADSRGVNFGDRGRWWLPERYVAKPFINQAWCITTLKFVQHS